MVSQKSAGLSCLVVYVRNFSTRSMLYEVQSVLLSDVFIELYIVVTVRSFCFAVPPHTSKTKAQLEEEYTN
jgi:hypothetical protein